MHISILAGDKWIGISTNRPIYIYRDRFKYHQRLTIESYNVYAIVTVSYMADYATNNEEMCCANDNSRVIAKQNSYTGDVIRLY